LRAALITGPPAAISLKKSTSLALPPFDASSCSTLLPRLTLVLALALMLVAVLLRPLVPELDGCG
jgi:hypothetical protein